MDTMLLHMEDPDASGGVIYVTVGDASFPEEGWYDLVHVDLENWLPRLLSFARRHTDSCTLQFMDAPASIRLTRRGEAVFAVCLWGHRPQIGETEIDFRGCLESVAGCIRRYNRALHEMGKSSHFETELVVIKTILIGETYV